MGEIMIDILRDISSIFLIEPFNYIISLYILMSLIGLIGKIRRI